MAVALPFAVGLLGSEIYVLQAYSDAFGPLSGSLYYPPIVIAAITLGAGPALAVALAASGAHMLLAARLHEGVLVQSLAQAVLFVCVALTAASLSKWRSGVTRAVVGRVTGQAPSGDRVQAGDMRSNTCPLDRAVIGMVRQIVTPVTSIDGAGWVLESPQLPEEKRQELVAIVRKETHRLNRLLSDLMEFAQPHQPKFRMVDVAPLLNEVIEIAKSKEYAHKHTFRKEVPPDLPPIRCDLEQIRQVLLNLITNAVQATPRGGDVEISARFQGGEMVFAVRDYGNGIPRSAVDKIFDPFFTTHEHNLGLGLPIALRIVTHHGGRMAVDCKQGEGTTMSVILPIVKSITKTTL
jgi:signal transduction histidine kinase